MSRADLATIMPKLKLAAVVALGQYASPLHAFWFERGARASASTAGSSRTLNIADFGAVPNASDLGTATANSAAINAALGNLTAGDTLLVPAGKEFYALGGMSAANLTDVTIQLAGTLRALADFDHWPLNERVKQQRQQKNDHGERKEEGGGGSSSGSYADFLALYNCSYVTLQGGGLVDGMGKPWWNAELLGQLKAGRPKLVHLHSSSNVLVQDLVLHSSPSFHLQFDGVAEVEVRNITIHTDRQEIAEAKDALRRRQRRRSGWSGVKAHGGDDDAGEPGLEPEDLNTDGIDASGRDVWIHDCSILNDDDSIAIKPCNSGAGSCPFSSCSENMLIENLVLTGG